MRCFRSASVKLAGLLLALPIAAGAHGVRGGEDLARRYPATMSWSESGLDWVCGPEDVWELDSFELHMGKELEIACKKATVALGRHGTNVLWAVVFPDKPAKIRSELAGDGESTEAILLRFAPSDVGRIFPSSTVGDPGEPWLRARAGRIFERKLGWRWSTPSGNPTVVPAGFVIVDADTTAGTRRFYGLDRNAGKVEYVADFETKPVPPAAPIGKKDALEDFEEVWTAFDREYAQFEALPELDWDAVRKQYAKAAGAAGTNFDLAAVLADMLAHLEDLHVWVRCGEDWLPGYTRERPLNASWNASLAAMGETQELGKDLVYGRTADGIGYLNVHRLGDPELAAHADRALEELADTWALVIDLRFNGGGDELLARAVAGRFLDEERTYSKNRYRIGPEHDDLGELLERRAAPRGPWRYAAPVIVLQGRKTLSSAESFALMLAQCPQVTTTGDRTGGSSGNPRLLELACGIAVNLPRWLDLDPDGNPIERVGIAPDMQVDLAPEAFTPTEDPLLQVALERLRELPERKRAPARR